MFQGDNLLKNKITTLPINEGINFRYICNEKFKHNRITINFILESEREKATVNALLPFILRQGSEIFPNFTMLNQKLCELYGAYLSADVSKFGAYQVLDLSIISIDNRFALDKTDILKECCKLLNSLIFKPILNTEYFTDNILVNEKQFLIDTIYSEINDKQTYALIQCKDYMCANEPFSVKRYGYIDEVPSITKENLQSAFNEILHTAQIEIMFVGSGNPNEVYEYFLNNFPLMGRECKKCNNSIIREKSEVKYINEQIEMSQSKLVLGFKLLGEISEKEMNSISFFTSIFGEVPSSKLFKSIREKLEICYYCSAQLDKSAKIMFVDCGIDKSNKDVAVKEIVNQLELCQKGNITQNELDDLKTSTKNIVGEINDSIDSLEDWYMLRILEGELISPEDRLNKYSELTVEDIVKASQKISLDTVYFLSE